MSNANFSHCKPALCTIVKLHKIRLLKCTYYRHVGRVEAGGVYPPDFGPSLTTCPQIFGTNVITRPPRFSDLAAGLRK